MYTVCEFLCVFVCVRTYIQQICRIIDCVEFDIVYKCMYIRHVVCVFKLWGTL